MPSRNEPGRVIGTLLYLTLTGKAYFALLHSLTRLVGWFFGGMTLVASFSAFFFLSLCFASFLFKLKLIKY